MPTKPAVVHSDPDILSCTPMFMGTRVAVRSLFDYIEGGDTFLRLETENINHDVIHPDGGVGDVVRNIDAQCNRSPKGPSDLASL